MEDGSGSQRRSRSERAKTSKCVRFNVEGVLVHRFNKVGFKSEVRQHLYYFYLKCYEQKLRGQEESVVMRRKEFLRYRGLLEIKPLKELPAGFQDFLKPIKIGTLQGFSEEQADAAVEIVGQNEVLQDAQGNYSDDMEVDEGREADLGPEVSLPLDGDSVQHVARNQQDNPQGCPPSSSGLHPDDEFYQCWSNLKRRASKHPDILLELETLEPHCVSIYKKLKDRELCEASGVDLRSTHLRSRQEEILSQEEILPQIIENIKVMDSQSIGPQANNFGEDVERGVKNNVTIMPHVEQDPAADPEVDPLSTPSSLGVLPDQNIREALEVAPIYTGQLKANLEEIRPEVFDENMAGDLQFQRSKPMMEIIRMGYSITAEPPGSERTMQEILADVEELLNDYQSNQSTDLVFTPPWTSRLSTSLRVMIQH